MVYNESSKQQTRVKIMEFSDIEVSYNNHTYYVDSFEIEVTACHYIPAKLWALPEDCYPEDSECEFQVIPNSIVVMDENSVSSMAPFLADSIAEQKHAYIEDKIWQAYDSNDL